MLKVKMKKILAVFLLIFTVFGFFAIYYFFSMNLHNRKSDFYFGVAFCGNTTQEAKLLIDKVKDYTNLFVLQSGPKNNES